jgi:hypothetical protein
MAALSLLAALQFLLHEQEMAEPEAQEPDESSREKGTGKGAVPV